MTLWEDIWLLKELELEEKESKDIDLLVNTENLEKTELENTENPENKENTEIKENTENKENTDNLENKENLEKKEYLIIPTLFLSEILISKLLKKIFKLILKNAELLNLAKSFPLMEE